MKALVIGHSAYDITCQIDKFPEQNTKTRFSDIVESGGGCAATMAYVLGKYGVETYLGSVVGDDTYGNLIKKGLEKVGVHTEYMETAYERKTPLAFILSDKNTAQRTVYSVEKENLLLKKNEFQLTPDIILIDGYDYGASLAALNKYPNALSIIDAGSPTQEILELCKYCKYIVASKEFAEKVSGQMINYENPQSLVYVFSSLLNKFPKKEIVVTLEERGALYIYNDQIKVMPGLQAEVVDTTAAGDIFHGAFAYALSQKYDIERTITFANIAAGISVTKIGAWNSVAEISDIMTYFNQKYPKETVETKAVTPPAAVQMPPDSL